MSIEAVIADNRKAIEADAAQAQAVFAAQGTLVGVTEVDIRTGAHTFKVDEPGSESAAGYAELAARVDEHCPILDLFKNPVLVTRELAAVR
jgi:hypothetical protein